MTFGFPTWVRWIWWKILQLLLFIRPSRIQSETCSKFHFSWFLFWNVLMSSRVTFSLFCATKFTVSAFIASFSWHFTYTETLWKVVKWSMKWPYSIQWGPIEMFWSSRTSFFMTIWSHVKLFSETFNIRWHWFIWKSPITVHPTSFSNIKNIYKFKQRKQ